MDILCEELKFIRLDLAASLGAIRSSVGTVHSLLFNRASLLPLAVHLLYGCSHLDF